MILEHEIAYQMKHQILKYDMDNNGCWIHKNKPDNTGYIRLKHGPTRISYSGHRLSYALFKGEIPKGKHVCHTCDVRVCVNPDHLFLGTPQDNAKDMYKKGRGVYHGTEQLTEEEIGMIFSFRKEGLTQKRIANLIGVTRSGVQKILKKGEDYYYRD